MQNTIQIENATFLISHHFSGSGNISDAICSSIIWQAKNGGPI